jgi:hypothetical protein
MTYKTTPERRANLVKLARFLYTEPIEAKQFRMSGFCTASPEYVATIERGCGTAGCAVGWGPAAGIAPLSCSENWDAYTDRVFGDDGDLWSWCFAPDWDAVDNTPKGAAKRILWALLNGMPSEVDSAAMWSEDAPLIYSGWTPTEADWQKAAVDA